MQTNNSIDYWRYRIFKELHGKISYTSQESTGVKERLSGKRTTPRRRDARADGGGAPDPRAWGKWRRPAKSFEMAAGDARDRDETTAAGDWWCSFVRWGSYSSGDLHRRGTVTNGGSQLEKKRHAAALTGDTDSEAAGGPTDSSASNNKIIIIPFLKIIKRKKSVVGPC
jgi:hypothetical protein